MNILVTGGTGFLGSNVCEKLTNAGHNVSTLDNNFTSDPNNKLLKNTNSIVGSITDPKIVDNLISEVDFVFHFAGILGTNETLDIVQKTNEVNINGTVNVLEACTKYDVPMLFTSKPNPEGFLNPYSITKVAAESYCMMFHEMYGTKVTVPKIMYLYGPRQLPYPLANYKKYIPTFALAALRGEPITIFGTGNQIIDPIYIDEAAVAMIEIMEDMTSNLLCNGKIYDVGTGIGISVNEIAKVIVHLTKTKSQILHTKMRPGEPDISTVIADVSQHPLGSRTHYNFYKGLSKTIEFYKDSGMV